MTDDDLTCDPAAMEAQALALQRSRAGDPWLERRKLGFGASDVGPLLVALGMREARTVPKYMAENAGRLFRVKAGLAKERKASKAAKAGSENERAVLQQWDAEAGAVRSMLGPLMHADLAPKSWFPLVDRTCPRLTCTPDGWSRSAFDDSDVLLEVKTTVDDCSEPPWYWRMQVQAQLAVTGCAWGVIVLGEHWAASWKEPGPITATVVDRDEAAIAEIREAAVEGWKRVEALKG